MKLELESAPEGAERRAFINGAEITDGLRRLEMNQGWSYDRRRIEATLEFDDILYVDRPRQPRLTTVTCADPDSCDEKFQDWLREHDLNPNQIHTIHNVNGAYLIVEGFAHDAKGSKFLDEDKENGAEFPPFAVRVKSPMPWVRGQSHTERV